MGSYSVYEFMKANNHCVRLAGFYLQWAGELEASGHFDEAAKIFQSGILVEAQPISSLVSAYEYVFTCYEEEFFKLVLF